MPGNKSPAILVSRATVSNAEAVLTGSKVADNRGYVVALMVLARTSRDLNVVREQIFEPVVCVQPFEEDDLDDIAKFANDTGYGLSALTWIQSLARTLPRAKSKPALFGSIVSAVLRPRL